jgi:hypothetical protein
MNVEMLPNKFHPGGRCSCSACLELFPTTNARTRSPYTLADLGVLVTAGDSGSDLKRMAISLAFEMGRTAGIVEAAQAIAGTGVKR